MRKVNSDKSEKGKKVGSGKSENGGKGGKSKDRKVKMVKMKMRKEER